MVAQKIFSMSSITLKHQNWLLGSNGMCAYNCAYGMTYHSKCNCGASLK